jgi:hypothetical protein
MKCIAGASASTVYGVSLSSRIYMLNNNCFEDKRLPGLLNSFSLGEYTIAATGGIGGSSGGSQMFDAVWGLNDQGQAYWYRDNIWTNYGNGFSRLYVGSGLIEGDEGAPEN